VTVLAQTHTKPLHRPLAPSCWSPLLKILRHPQHRRTGEKVLAHDECASTGMGKKRTHRFLEEHLKHSLSIPGMVHCRINDALIIIAIMYDNILVATSSKKLLEDTVLRLKSNCRAYNTIFKHINITTNKAAFCGIEIEITQSKLAWRTSPEVLNKWKNVFLVDHPQTPAFAMQAFGYFSRTQHIRLKSNYRYKEMGRR
jgi:hypothetical protein